MDELYNLLSNLLEVEYQQTALLFVLDILSWECQIKKEEKTSLLLCLCKSCLLTTKQCTRDAIRTLDNTLLELKHTGGLK